MYVKQWNPPIYQVIWQLNYAKILYWAYYIAQKHYLYNAVLVIDNAVIKSDRN